MSRIRINYVGSGVAPDAWKDEREFFRDDPYRGIEGKLKKIREVIKIPAIDKGKRPYQYQTICSLAKLRDSLVHGKPERYRLEVKHKEGGETDMFPIKIYKVCSQKQAHRALQDVRAFIEYIHSYVYEKLGYYTGHMALTGPLASASGGRGFE